MNASSERRPGAVYVRGRAPGSYPAWGRQQYRNTQPPLPGRGLTDPSVIDANAYSETNIGFTMVGEGVSARIMPFDTVIMSSRNLLSTASRLPWNCPLCSYENVDGSSTACSVCGSPRGSSSRGLVPVASVEEVAEVVVVEPPVEPPSTASRGESSRSMASADSFGDSGPTALPASRRRNSRPDRRALMKSPSFKQALGTSFANWSKNDKGPWTCSCCTYLNQEALHLTCGVCGQTRPKELDSGETVGDGDQSLTDYLNSSFGSGQMKFMEDKEQTLQEIEEGVIEQERMYELIDEQRRILSEMQAEIDMHESRSSNQFNTEDPAEPEWPQGDETRRELQRVREELEGALESEKHQLEFAEELQRRRRTEIEHEEGVSLNEPHLSGTKTQSPAVLDWMVQERMLQDWKSQRVTREKQLKDVRSLQERMFESHEAVLQGV